MCTLEIHVGSAEVCPEMRLRAFALARLDQLSQTSLNAPPRVHFPNNL